MQQSNAKLAGIVNYCADGIVILDEDGIIEQVNPACENLIGLVNEKIVKSLVDDFLFSKKTFISKELHSTEESELFLRDFYIKNPLSNNIIPVEISFARINPDSEFKKFVGVIRDVTEQKKSDRLRDDFIATLTHDLRTPLLAAIQTLKFFLDGAVGELDEKQKLLLATMQKSNEDLLGLVNALLEVYKYDAEKLVLNKTSFNIYELTKLVYDELKPLADKKKIDFSINCEDSELEIIAERSELRRVICNLCGNAINYTSEEGKVVIFGCGLGIPFFSTDTAGAVKAAEISADAMLMAKNVDYIYTDDPKKNPNAKKLETVTASEVLALNLKAIDATATAFCKSNGLPIHVFGLKNPADIKKALKGESVGTVVLAE